MTMIEITRLDGARAGAAVPVGKTLTVESWDEADEILRCIARDKARAGSDGCDEVAFVVHFDDGEKYPGCAGVTANGEDTHLAGHILEFMRFLAGEWRPAHFTDDMWEAACAENECGGYAQRAGEFLANYEVGDYMAVEKPKAALHSR